MNGTIRATAQPELPVEKTAFKLLEAPDEEMVQTLEQVPLSGIGIRMELAAVQPALSVTETL